jgi:hypothetical protein
VTKPPRFSIRVQGQDLLITIEAGQASVGYQVNPEAEDKGWKLYSRPIQLQPGDRLAAQAIRYGYATSEVAELTLLKPKKDRD